MARKHGMTKKQVSSAQKKGKVGANEFFAAIEPQVRGIHPEMNYDDLTKKVAEEALERLKSMGIKNDDPLFDELIGSLSEEAQKKANIMAGKSAAPQAPSAAAGPSNASVPVKPSDTGSAPPVENKELEKTVVTLEKVTKIQEKTTKEAPHRIKKVREGIDKETKNLEERGRIIDLEMKQAKLYEKNIAKGEIESKVMFERTNKSLMHLLELQKKEQETINSTENELKILKEIRDTLKEARGARLEDSQKYKAKIDYLHGQYRESTASRGDMEAYAYGERIVKTAKGAFVPGAGLATKLGQHYKAQAAEWGSELYHKTIPRGLQIIGEHVVGKIFNSKKDQKDEALNIARGRYDMLQHTIEEGLDGGSKKGKGWRDQALPERVIATQTMSGQSLSNKNDMKIAELKVDKLIVLDHNIITNAEQKTLDEESNKHNTVPNKGDKKGAGGFLGGLMSLFGSFKTSIMGIVGTIVKIGSSLAPLLSALLPVLAVVGAAIAGWKIGSWINDKVGGNISKAVSKIDGSDAAAKKAIAPTTDADFSPEAKIRIDEGRKARGLEPKYEKDSQVVGLRTFNPDAAIAAEKQGREMALAKKNPETKPEDAPDRVIPNSTPTPAGRLETETKQTSESPNVVSQSDVRSPQAAIAARTSMVVDASKSVEDAKTVRTAAPVVINNVTNNGGGKSSAPDLPISMGSARNQENGFMRYLLSVEAPM